MRLLKNYGLLAIGSLFLSNTLYASGFYSPLHSANQLARGGASMTETKHADVVAVNPAGMAFLSQGWHISGSLITVSGGFEWDGPDPDTGSQTTGSATVEGSVLPSLQLTKSAGSGGRFHYGFAIKTPFGNKLDWGKSWAGRELGTNAEFGMVSLNPNIAYAINKQQAFSIGMSYTTAQNKASRVIRMSNLPSIGGVELGLKGQDVGEVVSNFEGTAIHWNIGYLGSFQPGFLDKKQVLLVAAHYLSPLQMKYQGTLDFPPTPMDVDPQAGLEFKDLNAKMTQNLPWILELGLGWKDHSLHPTFEIEVGLVRVGWSNYHDVLVELDDPSTFFANSPFAQDVSETTNDSGQTVKVAKKVAEPRNYKDANTYRIGGAWHFQDRWTWMAGMASDEDPVPSKYREPLLPLGTIFTIATGIEWEWKEKQAISFQLAVNQMPRVKTKDTVFSVIDGTETDVSTALEAQTDPSILNIPFVGGYKGQTQLLSVSYHASW